MAVLQISALELQAKLNNKESFFLLDVREPNEYEYARILGSQLIPLQQIPNRIGEIDTHQVVIVLCHHGVRSRQAAEYLVSKGIKHVYNVSGGIDAWSRECDASVPRY